VVHEDTGELTSETELPMFHGPLAGHPVRLPTSESSNGAIDMLKSILALTAMLGTIGAVMAQDRIRIASSWGEVTAEIADTDAGAALMDMLPLTIEMRDHLRQEKTGFLPKDVPTGERQGQFRTGTLGLWSNNHFVIYYRDGSVPQPGIRILGQVVGDVSIFDQPGDVTVEISRID